MRALSIRKSHGFSLIEMLVTLTIVLFMSGLVLAGLRSSKNYQVLDQAAARLGMLIELAQRTALSENESFYLVLADHRFHAAEVPMWDSFLERGLIWIYS
jgi:type II secretion system protein H